MREVSCRAVEPFLQAADRRGIARTDLTRGVGYALSHLEDRHERIDWDAFRRFMANVRSHFDERALTQIGADGVRSSGARAFSLIGRTLFSAGGFYRWLLTSGGLGNQMFSNMTPSYRELAPGRLQLDLEVDPGYEPCPDFFHFAAGGFQALPALLGLAEAQIVMSWLPRGARFQIVFDEGNSRRARLLRLLTRKQDARATARELEETIHVIERRNLDLQTANAEVERQRELINQAYRLGQQIWGHHDLGKIADVVLDSLVSARWVCGARLVTGDLDRSAGATPGARNFEVDLPGGYGRLEAWADEAARPLLELLAPTIALAIANALAYRELAQYQVGLEQLVDERTAQLRQARDELAATVGQLRDAQQARELFFGNISHEIRTPLSLILLAVADVELRAGAALDDRGRRSLGAVGDAARKLVRLVDELLLLAAGQEDKLKIHPEPSELASLVETLAAAWRPAAEAAGLDLVAHPTSPLPARVDPIAFERVAANLVSNAIKYTPRGGRVELALAREGGAVRLSVLDTGPGIDADLASRLFGRFERAAGVQRRQIGTGIGLSLVKQLVEAHGGTVEARRREPHGTEMCVVLPGVVLEDTLLPAITRLHVGAASVPPVGGIVSGTRLDPSGVSAGTIVLAEDDAALADEIARLLAEDYTVHVALDGEAALELVRRHQPQMLVSDVAMPGMSGIELARRFREITGDRLAPIVIISAVIDLGTRLAGLEAGAVDYVIKPFEPVELRARVRAQFRARELAVRLHRAEQVSTLGMLTSGLAHELRNPANGIVNAIAPLRAALPPALTSPDTGPGQLLDVLAECAQQIGELSRQLLGFRRGATEILARDAPLATLVQRAAIVAGRSLEGVAFRREVADGTVRGAPALLVQVLANLLENAAHAAGRGGWVELVARTSHDTVTVEVGDSGPGVPAELRERVFEPFFTTKPPGVGTGLGLSVARAIAQRHGGVLELRTRGGRHVFVLELPAETVVARTAGAL